VNSTWQFEGLEYLDHFWLFDAENEGSVFLQNTGKWLCNDTESHPATVEAQLLAQTEFFSVLRTACGSECNFSFCCCAAYGTTPNKNRLQIKQGRHVKLTVI
jgi:hypothetical protein